MNLLKWLLIKKLKHPQQKSSGFTLIELLVAMILGVLVITPLLGFMINILDTDRREQVKTNTEQDVKASLEYIKRDLQESVYIYDADGINEIRKRLPKYDKKDTHFPVLVFWKRQFKEKGFNLGTTEKDDAFAYSLVAYYIIKDNNLTWSKAARIGRFQLSDGYGPTDAIKTSTRDKGFQRFSLKGTGDLKTKMNAWQPSSETITNDIVTLTDYIDQTTIDTSKNPAPACPLPPPNTPPAPPIPPMQLIPKYGGSGDVAPTASVNTRGFYVCVDSTNTAAEIYIRGNAIARLQNNNINFDRNQTSANSYFPLSSIRVKGRGFVFTK
ncbi:MAG: prepilin-type N-terminal cleavage/methylation domain-containing protein [Calothrix sp. CSU_2_0]|nr:prepilin-type N-terminal cleavage/methylation domain-containing protein [Calothrix sp. CSU_2_0]